MKSQEQLKKIRSEDPKTILKNIEGLKIDLVKTKMDIAFGKTKNIAGVAKLKSKIAQRYTILNEKILQKAVYEK